MQKIQLIALNAETGAEMFVKYEDFPRSVIIREKGKIVEFIEPTIDSIEKLQQSYGMEGVDFEESDYFDVFNNAKEVRYEGK